jgi:hypothetical protein
MFRTLYYHRAPSKSTKSTPYATANTNSLCQTLLRRTANMGRGGYDTTTASSDAAAKAIEEYEEKQAEAQVRRRIALGFTIRN